MAPLSAPLSPDPVAVSDGNSSLPRSRCGPQARELLGKARLCLLLVVAGCLFSEAVSQTSPEKPLRYEVVETGTELVTGLEFTPDGRLLYATQDGAVYLKKVNFEQPWNSPPSALLLEVQVARSSFENGLLGLAVDPDFEANRRFYLYYTAPNPEGLPRGGRIARYRLEEQTAAEETVIVEDLPAREDQKFHFGGGLAFGPDGKLYLIFGDTNRPKSAADPDLVTGSILRYNSDGSIPSDNPFPNSPVLASGIRNGFALAWRPRSGQLYLVENGTHCDDELNLIRPGGNYGWGQYRFDTCPYPDDRGIAPIHQWNPVISPAGMVFYQGSVIPEWEGDLLVCGFSTLALYRLRLSPDGGSVLREEKVEIDGLNYSCRVDIEVGPDGWLYTTTDSVILRIGR